MGEEIAVAQPGLGAEAVELLGELIQINTVNPPGREAEAQELEAGIAAYEPAAA